MSPIDPSKHASLAMAFDQHSVPRRDLLITLAALALLLCWEASGWDLVLAGVYADVHGFALRDHWFYSQVVHKGGRVVSGVVLAAVLGWALFGNARAMARRLRLAWAGVVLLCLLAVPALKRFSSTSCPWDIDDFGGKFDFVPHWMLGVSDGGPGHCFPSGHAVAAFAFLPLYFQWRRTRPRAALAMLAATLAVGLLFGWAQLARGAHFPSHTMWSAWLCWAIGAVAARALDRDQPISTLSINRVLPSLAAASATSGSPADDAAKSR
jgi:membrane-associated PAP2 superfamily phosphatase